MPLPSDQGLFAVLEKELRKAPKPLDCATLYDKASIRAHATTVNRVSDYLGNMWRKGLVLRLPAPKLDGTKARWLYVWKEKGPKKEPVIDMSQAIEYNAALDSMLHKPAVHVSEDGKTVTISTQYAVITVQQREP